MTEAPNTLLAPMASFPEGSVVRLALDRIVSSPTNPRKTFNPEKLAELATSIRASGVHSPILVRPLPGDRVQETYDNRLPGGELPDFELVYGERRWRASRLADAVDIPVVVRHLTDDQVLDIQITENLQRDDLLPLEEAEGYQLLMDHSKLSADQVAVKIGKSKAYVYAKLKLLALGPAGRDALRAAKIDASKALLVARIPDEKLQAKALQYLTRTGYDGEVPSYREAARHIQDEFMLRLDQARFKTTDATLVPEAGACPQCPLRTGHEPDLFADIKSADVCTFPPCYRRKEEAQSARMVQAAEAKGQTVISGKEAEELKIGGYGQSKLKGYKRLDNAEDSPTGVALRKIIGKLMESEGIKPVMIESPHKKGQLEACLPNEVALRLLKIVDSQAQSAKVVAKEVREFVDEKRAKAEAKAKALYEASWRTQLLLNTWNVLKDGDAAAFNLDVHRLLVRSAAHSLSADDAAALCALLDLGKVSPHGALLSLCDETPSPDLLHLLIIMQRDSGPHDASYTDGVRVENRGLMLVAGNVFGQRLGAEIAGVKAQAKDKHLPAVKSPKAPVPQAPAAQASGVRGEKKGKGKKTSAAPAAKVPKISTAHATALIAEAMQAIPDAGQGSADASQSDEAVPVLRQAPAPDAMPAAVDVDAGSDTGAAEAAQGDEGQAVLRQPAATALPFGIGQAVKFKEGIRGPDRHIRKVAGRTGTIEARSGSDWMVRCGFKPTDLAKAREDELEPLGAAPTEADGLVINQRVMVNPNVAAHMQPWAGQLGRIVEQSKNGVAWEVRLDPANKKKAQVQTFAPGELVVVAA